MSIVIAILIFGLIVLLHELGHFTVAKLTGVTVYQFSIGFGPAIFKKQVGETVYAIRCIPLGGYVAMKGEDSTVIETPAGHEPEENPDDTEGSFLHAKWWKRFCISAAGSVMNLISALVILLLVMLPTEAVLVPEITSFMDGFQWSGQDGLQEGDEILKINGFHIFVYSDVVNALELGQGKPYTVVVRRGGEKVTLDNLMLTKDIPDENSGGQLKFGLIFGAEALSVPQRLGTAWNSCLSFVQTAYKSIGMLLSGQVSADNMMGTVGITNELSERVKSSWGDVWYFVAFLSVNLAVVNLLPIPGLDGGKLLFLFIELLRGKPIKPEHEGAVQLVGMLLILGLFVFVTYHDIVNLFTRAGA